MVKAVFGGAGTFQLQGPLTCEDLGAIGILDRDLVDRDPFTEP